MYLISPTSRAPSPLLPFTCHSPIWKKNLFSPQPSAAMKIKDGSYDFYRENTEYLRAKITQASRKMFKVPCEARTKTIIR